MSSRHRTDRAQLFKGRTARARKTGRGIPRVALGSHETQGACGRWAGWKGGETALETGAPPNTKGQQLVQGQVIDLTSCRCESDSKLPRPHADGAHRR